MATLAALVMLASVAHAAPQADVTTQRQADALFDAGQASYQQGQFQRAINQFKKAYDLVHDPIYLFNVAQSYRKIGDCVGAHDYYRKYLAETPLAQNKDKVEQWIRELQPCVDEREREKQEAARRAAEEAELRRAREDERPAPVDTQVDQGKPLRLGGIVLASAGAFGLAAGIAYGIKGGRVRSDLDARCSPPNTCLWDSPEIQGLDADGRSANTRAAIGYVAGGIALVGGVALYLVGRSRIEQVTITPTGGGAMAGASLRF
jgi:tetratricopeptide (TPR) repeat protein